jgi:cell division protein ZapA
MAFERKSMATQVNVRIFGQEFTIKGEDSPEYVESLAQFVDKKMREVASASSVITSHKVAMLTAINIADELFRARKELEDNQQQLQEKASSLIGLLNDAIAE